MHFLDLSDFLIIFFFLYEINYIKEIIKKLSHNIFFLMSQ